MRRALGLYLIVSHLGLISLPIILFFVKGFLFEELTTTLALVIPVFASYTTVIVQYNIKHRHSRETRRQLSLEFVVIGFAMPTIFVLLLASAMLGKAFNVAFRDFEQFKAIAVTIESLFAVYVGLFISNLFELKETNRSPSSTIDSAAAQLDPEATA